LDDIIAFTKAGIMKVVRVSDKTFIGKDIIHAAVFQKGDERTTYNVIYVDGKTGTSFAKRFNVTGITREKEYDITKGSEKSKVHYFSANANGEAEVVKIILSPNCNAKKKEFEFYFEELEIKGRGSMGNTVTKYPIKTIRFKEAGKSTLDAKKLWYDDKFGRLNVEEKGHYLGKFEAEDRLVVFYKDGNYEMIDQELTQRFDGDKNQYNVKRFKIETTTLNSKYFFIKEGKNNTLTAISSDELPLLNVKTGKGQQVNNVKFKVDKLVEVMGWKAIGTKLMDYNKNIEMEFVQPKEETAQQDLFE
jgi:topoisomerase IV subunit A